jgi:isopentenyldiphosphate isomerase
MELLDVYTQEHKLTGRTTLRNDPKLGKEDRLLVVHICIFNAEGKMLIQQRQSWKKHHANCWDISAGGFARSGEDAVSAALRETHEELGLTISKDDLDFAFTVNFFYVLDDFFTVQNKEIHIAQLTLQQEEVADVRWASLEDILKMLKDGTFVDYDAALFRKIFSNLQP